MGLLDAVVGALGQGGGGGGGGNNALLGAVISMLTQGGGAGGGGAGMASAGGLGALLEKFQQGGLGDVASSWVGRGENLPISADQLSQVLGGDTLGKLAQQLGMGQGDVAGQLSQMLPGLVDRMTPDGAVPTDGGLANLGGIAEQAGLGDLGKLVGGFLGR
jgi:uncharacterized protein YidB (DUF937 family)